MATNRLKDLVFNESTTISMSMAVIVIGFGYFLGEVTNTASANTNRITRMQESRQQEISEIRQEILKIHEKSSEISGKIDVLLYESYRNKPLKRSTD